LRACQRIGEISRELEKVETAGPSSVRIPASGKPKAQVLAEAGISTSTANRYEQLTGSSDEQGIVAGLAATEAYFAKARAEQKPPTMRGLEKAIDDALDETLGPRPPVSKRKPMSKEAAEFADWTGAVITIGELDCDMRDMATRFGVASDLLDEALAALPRLQAWISILEGVCAR